jgi:pantothenate kinase
VEPKHHIAVIEGNYWLLQENPWQRFQDLFDIRIFLTASREQLVNGLYQRHLRGGKTKEVISRQIASVDLPNIDRVLKYSGHADVVVHKSDNRNIISVEYFK